MAVAMSGTDHEMERTLAEVVGREALVLSLWASRDGDGLHFWLVTQPIEAEVERRLYELADALDERFPDVDFQIHVLNQRHYVRDARDSVPAGAAEIRLPAA